MVMPIDFLIHKGHSSHHTFHSGSIGLSKVLLSLLLLFVAFLFRFELLHFSEIHFLGLGYQKVKQAVAYVPDKLVYFRVNPEFEKRQRAIRNILKVLESHGTGLSPIVREELARVIYEESTRHNQDPKFILAVIATESSFQSRSVSEQGAKGLMQIMPWVAESIAREIGIKWRGEQTLFDPCLNTRIGIHYLSGLLLDFKDTRLALTAYNYGPTYVKSRLEKKRRVPKNYYEKIVATYNDLVVSAIMRGDIPPPDEMQAFEIPI